MGEGAVRNQPCPCGSGKKYKHCHVGREAQTPLPFNDMRVAQRKAFSKRYCLLTTTGACSGNIVSAHSVPRSRLRLIARDGKAYVVDHELATLFKNNGVFDLALRGVAQCTTFSGFCQAHDKSVFAPVEDVPFSGTPEQCFLLYFRSLAREFYAKRAREAMTPTFRELDRGRDVAQQVEIQRYATDCEKGLSLAFRDLNRWWDPAARSLESGTFDEYESAIFYYDQRAGVACSGGIFPEFDFAGKRVQSLGRAGAHFLSFTSLPLDASRDGDVHGVAAFVWHRESHRARAVVDSLVAMPRERQADAIVRFSFEQFENVVLDPRWWEGLTEEHRRRLRARLSAGILTDQDPMSLVEDGISVATWSVAQLRRS